MRLHRRALLASLLASLVAAPSVTAEEAPREGDAVWPFLRPLQGATRLAVLEREAAREGQVTIYAAIAIERGQILMDLFHARYPAIKLDFVRLTTTDLPARMLTEARAGHPRADVAIIAADRLDIMSTAIAPYEPTTWSDFDPRFRHGGTDQGWAALDYELLNEAIAWRTDRVQAAEAPKTLDQLADPKWKGRTGTITSLEHLYAALAQSYGDEAAAAKIEALAALGNRLYPSIAGLSEALGAGQIDVAWGVSAMRIEKLKAAGAPVEFVYQMPPTGNPDSVLVVRGALHPYAAALFMEFLTDARTLEAIDKREPGMTFGNMRGTYQQSLAAFPGIAIYGPIPEAEYRVRNRKVEQLFVRRR